MSDSLIVMVLVNFVIFLLSVSIGKSLLLIKIRKEENKKRELELSILEKRNEIISKNKEISENLEEFLYKTQVQQEIDKIIRKNDIS